MNFYFSLFQLIETVESLGRNVQHLASRALRISPRDARANRELLEKCELKLNEVRVLLNNKTHIRKIVLRKASYLFQILDVFYRRVLHLSTATASIGPDDENSVKAVWQLQALAQKHYQIVVHTLFELTGIPVTLALDASREYGARDFNSVIQDEAVCHQEALKLLEKAIEVFGEEQELADKLVLMRKEILEIKKRMKHFSPVPAVEKAEPVMAPVSAAIASSSKN